jgi:hypothetical protein
MSSIGITWACPPPACAAFHAEHRPEARFAQADHRFFADAAQPVAKADAGGGFPLPGRGWADGSHQDELASRPFGQGVEVAQIHFGLVVAIGFQHFVRDVEFVGGELSYAFWGRRLCNFDVCQHKCRKKMERGGKIGICWNGGMRI